MKAIIPNLDPNSATPLYLQLYNYLKSAILNKDIVPEEKLPSLRSLSESFSISLTTVEMAYNQLNVEGYIYSKPKSGFFVSHIPSPHHGEQVKDGHVYTYQDYVEGEEEFLYDLSCFDFNKWKKCINRVLNYNPEALLSEGDPQGEEVLRHEISKYVYSSRGVKCTPDQIIIGAGIQQLTSHLSTVLKRVPIVNVAVEDPGYLPVRNIFRDRGFNITPVPVKSDGIEIDRLPNNIPSAVYVNPSNQYPTGAVTPIGRRYQILKWADQNQSYIIEDDYDSELRYFGKPIPALQGLDTKSRVVYLGSFSSTLFSAIRISYMVLPMDLWEIFHPIKNDYSQTCSKLEQLTLALFMEQGHYQRGIKKLRRLYTQKLSKVMESISNCPQITAVNSNSGVNMIIKAQSSKSKEQLCQEAKSLGIYMIPAKFQSEAIEAEPISNLVFYYNRLPLSQIPSIMKELLSLWF